MTAATRFGLLGTWLVLAWPTLVCAKSTPARPAPLFHDVVEAAWARFPDRPIMEARRQEAAIRTRSAQAFFPNAPTATGTFIDDRAGSAQGYTTYQGEIGTPIWLPGEGTATADVAHADLARAVADVEAAHLAVAQQLLDAVLQAAQAENLQDVAKRRLRTSQSLAADLNHRQREGENAPADALAADADAASARVSLADADAQVEAARAGLAAITGIEETPRLVATPHRLTAKILA